MAMEKANIGGVYKCVMPVRWGDTDSLRHVNNTVYFRFQEEARVQLFIDAGIPVPDKKTIILAHANCDFLKPIFYPATVVVELVLSKLGNTSMTLDHVIKCNEDASLVYAKGSSVFVSANTETGKPQPWTSAEIAAFNSCLV